MAKRKLPDAETLRRLYWDDGLTGYQIAERYHCGNRRVYQAMKVAGIPRRDPHKIPSIAELNRLYWLEGLTTQQIAERYHCHRNTVLICLTEANIPRKRRRRPVECSVIHVEDPIVINDPASYAFVCGKPVCLIKRWDHRRKRFYWSATSRCLTHYVEMRRRIFREAARRRRQSPSRHILGPPAIRYSLNWVREIPA